VKFRTDPLILAKPNIGATKLSGIPAVDNILKLSAVQKISNTFQLAIAHPVYDIHHKELEKWKTFEFESSKDMRRALFALASLDEIEYVGENQAFKLDYVPNDPQINEQWALAKMGVFDAWDIETGSKDVLIAVIDTGIDYLHPDLVNNIWTNEIEDLDHNGYLSDADLNGVDDDGNGFVDDVFGWDFTDAPNYPDGGDYLTPDNDPMDEFGHGTGVAGIIAAKANNGFGIAGLAHHCKIINLRAFTSGGNGEEDDVASAILYAINNGAKIINMSWGDVFVSRVVDDVIRYATSKGVVLVASAGNSSTEKIHYPSGFEGTISVGATNQEDNLAGFSNFGPSVDLVAPGVDILTTAFDSKFTQSNGTSFAAPFVSAAAALLLSQNPDIGASVVRGNLLKSAVDLGPTGWDEMYASGRLDVNSLLLNPLHSLVEISFPFLDKGISDGPVEITGSAWGPTLERYTIYYGEGDNPNEWTFITQNNVPVIDGLLGYWNTIPTKEGPYTIKLEAINRDGSMDTDFSRIFVDSSSPIVSDVQLLPMLDGDTFSLLVQFETDDLSEGSLFFRPQNTTVDFEEAVLSYRTTQHKYNLTQDKIADKVEIKTSAQNRAGLISSNSTIYTANLGQPPIDVQSYSPTGQTLPSGLLLSKSHDFNGNGLPEIIVGTKQNGAISDIKFFEWTSAGVQQVFVLANALIPRDIGDSDGDGKWEILCGYGFNSYLYESPELGAFPEQLIQKWEGDGATQYWASKIADLDNDGRGEIIMRTVNPEGPIEDRFEIFEHSGDNVYEIVASLDNPTEGENQNGVPHCEIGDFDGDGRNEILLGDSDGDLYIYENNGDNSFEQIWQYRMPLLDTIDFISVGDFDGDRVMEFAAGCHTDPNLNTEHEYDARYWLYQIFDSPSNNLYESVAEFRLFGFESPKDFESGISSGDIDMDGDDELFVCAFPDFYIVDYLDANYEAIYHTSTVQSNTTFIGDSDNNGKREFWVGKSDGIEAFLSVGSNTSPAVPVAFKTRPLNGSHIQLSWREVEGAEQYIILRGTSETNKINYDISEVPNFIDEAVTEGQIYYYSVIAVDFQKDPTNSLPSQTLWAMPGKRPKIVRAEKESEKSIRLYFSKSMDQSAKNVSNYTVPSVGRPTSAILDKSGHQVVLSFDEAFRTNVEYELKGVDLFDTFNTPLDTLNNQVNFQILPSVSVPYLVAGGLLQNNQLQLEFSEDMDTKLLSISQNYSIDNDVNIKNVVTKNGDSKKVILEVESEQAFGALGRPFTIRIKNLKSQLGVAVQPGRGDYLQLIFSQSNLDNVFTYPNPYRPDLGVSGITFANLTKQAEIQIFTSQGVKVKSLKESNGDGGIEWNLLNEDGQPVSSGVYLYRAESDNQSVIGKFAIVR
jgi:hypothetical protein